jgi:hypothetical protein
MEDPVECPSFLPLQQSPAYAVTLAALGARTRWLDLGCGRALAIERGPLRLVMRGPVFGPGTPEADQRMALRALARWSGIVIVTPEDRVAGRGLIPIMTPMHHAVWTLGPDLRAGMAGKWRNTLSGAERAGLNVVRGTDATLDRLIAAEGLQRHQRRYRAVPERFTRALPAASLRIWEWQAGGKMAAAMAFIRHGTTASYHLAWGSELSRKAGAHALMLTRAAEALAAEGVRWLDLGAVDSERAPGLAMFKLGTGADLRRLGPTLLVLP